MSEPNRRHRTWRVIRTVLLCAGAAVLAVAFYVAMVLGRPDGQTTQTDQPVLEASASLYITEAWQLNDMAAAFPVPVLSAGSDPSLTLQSAACYDAAFEGGYARVMTVIYGTETGLTLRLDSIYPARALLLLGTLPQQDGGYAVSTTAGHTVAGNATVRMENKAHIRLHMQTADGLYAITLPQGIDNRTISSLVQALRLFHPQ